MIELLIVALVLLAFVIAANDTDYEHPRSKHEADMVCFELASRAFCFLCTLVAILVLALSGLSGGPHG